MYELLHDLLGDSLLVYVIGAALPLLFVLPFAVVAVLLEMKVSAHMQDRVAYMYTGWHGVLQPIADFIKLLQKEGKFTKEQMYTKFNMGMGFFIICEKDEAEDILQVVKEGAVVGEVRAAPSTKVVMDGIGFVGY